MLVSANRFAAGLAASVLVTSSLGVGIASASGRHHGARGNQNALGGRLITGRLSSSGYTVVPLGSNGRSTSSSSSRAFSLTVPASRYTLQLLNRHGVYAGPVVMGGRGSRVIVGLHGGIRLGRIDVFAAQGYARPVTAVPASALVKGDWAWARHGVPIGNGRNLGLVVSPTKGNGPSGPGGVRARPRRATGPAPPRSASPSTSRSAWLRREALSRSGSQSSSTSPPTARRRLTTPTRTSGSSGRRELDRVSDTVLTGRDRLPENHLRRSGPLGSLKLWAAMRT